MKILALTLVILQLLWRVTIAAPTAPPPASLLESRNESSPNPIGPLYPNQATGTLNSTISVVPIPYTLARSIIPSQYRILTKAYHSLLKGFPPDSYPLIIRGAYDHDVGLYALNFSIPDFQSIHILYPFVDLLGDGYSSFTYNKYVLITSTNSAAIAGATAGGTVAPPSTFQPELETYAFVPRSATSTPEIFLNAYTNLSTTKPAITTTFRPLKKVGPWPVSFFVNVTNQPIFSDGLTCDNQISLFNTSLSIGNNAPAGIHGKITIIPPYFPVEDCVFDDVYGIKVDVAFVENSGLQCADLKGWHATGSGD
ncbi:hypothetical protein EG329_014012 [Mollisiaceae sp. DMI_Dod_QoI]|nr:hypothetical protein EG329_014012 [Helotiales sp. DMI_Dod_QoI]